jgi:hypothetical protein
MPTKKQQDMGSDESGRMMTGGMGTSKAKPDEQRGGEHGEKRATNADHDQKVAENRKRLLKDQDNDRSDDDVLGQAEGRRQHDPDNERPAGDIVSGGEHSEFPGTQAGYDNRTSSQRPPHEANDDLGHLDRGKNDDLGHLDGKGDMEPLK